MKYRQLFWTFLRIGLLTIGGGYVMISLIEKEVVQKRQWLSGEDFLDMLALAQSAPGILVINTSVFVGYRVAGWRGVLSAAVGCILPSFAVILLIAMFFHNLRENPVIEQIFQGIRPAVAGLIAAAVWGMVKKLRPTWQGIIIMLAAAFLIWLWALSPIWIIIAAACWGVLAGLYHKKHQKSA
ncbi:MAG: chromate transporter [Bacteroidales bacterium]|jgi:chromate transporter|nr:chromate transporter [Bacteroidales bacterium]